MRIGIAATLKNEAPYLLEWIAFHRIVGIRTFFISDNGGDDGTSRLLRQLHRAGIITRFDFIDREVPQLSVYTEMVPRMRDIVELVAIIDGDEFIRPLEGERADQVIDAYFADPAVSALAINWACYGSGGQCRGGRGLVTARFRRRAEQGFSFNRLVKSIVRVDRFVSCTQPHFSNLSHGRFIDTGGEDVRWDPRGEPGALARCTWRGVRIDHFAVKSLEEFETIKSRRGRGDMPLGHPKTWRGSDYFKRLDRNEVFDPMPAWLISRTKQEAFHLRWQMTPFMEAARKIFAMSKTVRSRSLRA